MKKKEKKKVLKESGRKGRKGNYKKGRIARV